MKLKLLSLLVPIVTIATFYNYLTLKARGHFDVNDLKEYRSIMPIAVIGSGPGGLSAGVYGARSGNRTYIIEGNKPGGLLTETTDVENWPGEELILGPDLINKMHVQVQKLGATFVSQAVEAVDLNNWPYRIQFENGESAYALTIIIATGATPKRLGIPGELEYWGYGVTTCAICDAPFRKGQDVIVVGGGDSAIEEAIQLAPHVRSVVIMVRKEQMRAAARMQDRLKGYPNISVRYHVDVVEILGDRKPGKYGEIKQVTGVRVHDSKRNVTEAMMGIRGVFLAIGHTPNSQLFCPHLKCDEAGHIIPVGRSQKTSKEGVFVAGDVSDSTYRQAITSAGSGCMAALDAAAFLADIGFNEEVSDAIAHNYYRDQADNVQAVVHANSMQDIKNILSANSQGTVIIDFYGQQCPSCLQMMPIYEQVAREKSDKATFVKVDIDKAPDIVKAFKVLKVPCIKVIKEGKPQKTFYTTLRRKEIMALL